MMNSIRLQVNLAIAIGLVIALLAVVPAAIFGQAGVSSGEFRTLPAGEAVGRPIAGHVTVIRAQTWTAVNISQVTGLEPNQTYAVQFYNGPCTSGAGTALDQAGPGGESWPTLATNDVAVGRGYLMYPYRVGPAAQSVVIHAGPQGRPRLACADLAD